MPCNRPVGGRGESVHGGCGPPANHPNACPATTRPTGAIALVNVGSALKIKSQTLAQQFDRNSVAMTIGGGPFFYWSAGRCAVTDAPLEQLAVCRCARAVQARLICRPGAACRLHRRWWPPLIPAQWPPLIPAHDQRECTITLGSTIPWIKIPWITIPWITTTLGSRSPR